MTLQGKSSFPAAQGKNQKSKKPENKDCFGYIRVSSKMQKLDGASPETQKDEINKEIERNGWNLIKMYDDCGLSAKDMNRPDLIKLLQDLKPGMRVIIYDLSRLTRSTKDVINIIEEIHDKDCFLVCLQEKLDFSSPYGEAMYTIITAINQMNRKNIAINTSINMQNLSSTNQLRGRASYGYRFVGKDLPFEEVPEQIEVIDLIIKLHQFEHKNLTQIAKFLNQEGHNKTLGNSKKYPDKTRLFTANLVKKILIYSEILPPDKYITAKPYSQRFIGVRRKTSS